MFIIYRVFINYRDFKVIQIRLHSETFCDFKMITTWQFMEERDCNVFLLILFVVLKKLMVCNLSESVSSFVICALYAGVPIHWSFLTSSFWTELCSAYLDSKWLIAEHSFIQRKHFSLGKIQIGWILFFFLNWTPLKNALHFKVHSLLSIQAMDWKCSNDFFQKHFRF